MSLGDLRKFLSSIEGIADESPIRARVTFRKQLRSITVDDLDLGFHDYIRSVGIQDDDEIDEKDKTKASAKRN